MDIRFELMIAGATVAPAILIWACVFLISGWYTIINGILAIMAVLICIQTAVNTAEWLNLTQRIDKLDNQIRRN